MTKLDSALASRMAGIALGHVRQEYPHKLDHVLGADEDALSPRALHPIFYRQLRLAQLRPWLVDLLTLRRLFPDIPEAKAIGDLARDSFTRDNVAAELAYLERPLSRGFERPYGWAWLLYLHLEATRHPEAWGEDLEPLARAFAKRLRDHLPVLTYPIRVGTHSNTAFALVLSLEWAETFDLELAGTHPGLARSTGSPPTATARRGNPAATSSCRRR